ncbi:MAG: IS1380 family transposase [Mesoflavibacter sp.]|nr:IS1380 family transposase [Mesoflavibacter sp.]
MSNKGSAFYKGNKAIFVDFEAEKLSSDGGLIMLEKIERKHHIIKHFSDLIVDKRHSSYIKHSFHKLLMQRVFLLMQGYQDANDADLLKEDPILNLVLSGKPGSQPTISRFENSIDKFQTFSILEAWIDRYVANIGDRKKIIIDIDATDAETYGNQQLSLFSGFYNHTMYNELFFHDGQTGEIILPALRPGNAHSNWWFVAILKRVVNKIRDKHPNTTIIIRADSGFSSPKFYQYADSQENFKYTIAIASNNVLKNKVKRAEDAVRHLYLTNKEKHQHFIGPYSYQAGSWEQSQHCYSKIESTGKGMNIRHFISNFEQEDARNIYFDFYVKRGDASENRIKEAKSMCFSARLSNHEFWPNFFRLIISSIAYEMFRLIKLIIKTTNFEKAKKWQVNNIRLFLLKIGGTIKTTKRKVFLSFSKSFIYKDLFWQLITN